MGRNERAAGLTRLTWAAGTARSPSTHTMTRLTSLPGAGGVDGLTLRDRLSILTSAVWGG